MNLLLRSVLLRRGLSAAWRGSGLWLREFASKEQRVLDVLTHVFDVDLRALDAFLAKPNYWDSRASLRAKRDELLQRRADADKAFAAGQIDLAITTLLLINAEAKFVGMRVTANPVMVTHREAQERGKAAQKASADKKRAETEEKLSRFAEVHKALVQQYGRATRERLASELDVSLPILRGHIRKNSIEI